MKKYLKYNISAMMLFASALAVTSCDDWTEVESLEIHTPSIEDNNPGLYDDYLNNLNRYKKEDHKITIVSFENIAGAPTKKSEHLTALPDSVDIVCLNNPDKVSVEMEKEIQDIHAKGIRSVYMIDYAVFEDAWLDMIKANPALTEEDALTTLGQYVEAKLALCDQHGFDGVIADYFGRALVSMQEKDLTVYSNRQKTFFNKILEWKEAHQNKSIIFSGNVQFLVSDMIHALNDFEYIILKTKESTNGNDYTLKAYTALQAGEDLAKKEGLETNPVPNDRFIVTVELPQAGDKDKVKGYWTTTDQSGNKIMAAEGAAVWMGAHSTDFTRKGMLLMNVHNDYYNNTYEYVREVISIMNPNK